MQRLVFSTHNFFRSLLFAYHYIISKQRDEKKTRKIYVTTFSPTQKLLKIHFSRHTGRQEYIPAIMQRRRKKNRLCEKPFLPKKKRKKREMKRKIIKCNELANNTIDSVLGNHQIESTYIHSHSYVFTNSYGMKSLLHTHNSQFVILILICGDTTL